MEEKNTQEVLDQANEEAVQPSSPKSKIQLVKEWILNHKKITIGIAAGVVAVIIAIIVCVNVFSHHGIKPQLNIDDAKDALEDADYSVSYTDDEDDLAIGVKERLYAYNDDDYISIVVYEDAAYAKKQYEAAKIEFEAEIDLIKNSISILEYQLNHYEDDLSSDEIDDIEDEIKELEERLEEYDEEIVHGRSGNIVWYGTKNAAEDSKD